MQIIFTVAMRHLEKGFVQFRRPVSQLPARLDTLQILEAAFGQMGPLEHSVVVADAQGGTSRRLVVMCSD